MGLIHPIDLEAWQSWQDRQNLLRRIRHLGRSRGPAELEISIAGDSPSVLIAFDSLTWSSRAGLAKPLARLDPSQVAVLAPVGLDVVEQPHKTIKMHDEVEIARHCPKLDVIVSLGHFLPAGAMANELSKALDIPFVVVQHGLLTPHAPPLPSEATLLTWSDADGEFWRSGRDDVTVEVVGSQLLWQAAQRQSSEIDPTSSPTFLGQLHGAEIPRHEMAKVSVEFCRTNDARYRPHPSEVDKLSRLQHAWWQRRGVRFDTSGLPLSELATPVVGVFSTGVLEAAAAGKPAWVHHPHPPDWVAEMWDRYGLEQWGGNVTEPPTRPPVEPATRIAEILSSHLETKS